MPSYLEFMLKRHMHPGLAEAGCDEAGRGCLAGPVYAAAVILPDDFHHPLLDDSKKLTRQQRDDVRRTVEDEAHWAVASLTIDEIDRLNILHASIEAMHRAVNKLRRKPQFILVDGNRFRPHADVPHACVVKGDATFMSIAAASVLAKTHRDDFMESAHSKYPLYGWDRNKGYPTKQHREAIRAYGPSPLHRRSFRLLPDQGTLFEDGRGMRRR